MNALKIEVFKTKCRLPNGEIGEVCKDLENNGWLVCNKNGWWTCSSQWIENNFVIG